MRSFIKELNEFYPEYLKEHSDKRNRALHFIGTTLFFTLLAAAAITLTWWLVPLAIIIGYLLPGIGHKYLQHNESFRSTRPVLCVLSAFRLYIDMLTFRLRNKL
jgi:hypothetical protein